MTANCVSIILQTPSGGYYLADRIGTKDQQNFLAPPGGDAEPHLTIRANAVKELLEETDLNVREDRLQFAMQAGPFTRTKKDGTTANYFSHIFLLHLRTGEIPQRMEPQKHGDWMEYTAEAVLANPQSLLKGTAEGIRLAEAYKHSIDDAINRAKHKLAAVEPTVQR